MNGILAGLGGGIITALVTPLRRDYEIKDDILGELLEFQLRSGVKGFFVLGTYGEGVALPASKRMKFLEVLLEHLPSSVPVIVNVTSTSAESSLELARHAGDAGCPVVAAMPPLFYKPDSLGLREFYRFISKAGVPLMIYNNPGRQGYSLSVPEVEVLISDVSSIVGVKDSSGEVERIQALVERLGDKIFVAAAKDSLIAYSLLVGAHAHVCGLCNVIPEVAVRIYEYISGNKLREALELQSLVNRLREAVRETKLEAPAVVKELLRMRGIDVGMPVTPMRSLTKEESERLRNRIQPIIDEISERMGGSFGWALYET
ncbi:MAG: dihydrodipicolinate synthase family protein [Desulfurococcales archaeon]|nr:dihydrodipicolinate synthase family protein [Desulfurococcales archaeon]